MGSCLSWQQWSYLGAANYVLCENYTVLAGSPCPITTGYHNTQHFLLRTNGNIWNHPPFSSTATSNHWIIQDLDGENSYSIL